MRGGVLPWCPRWRPGLQRFQISGLFSRRELAVHGCPCHTTWVFRHGTRLDRSRRTSHARAHNNASACSSHLPSCLFREGQAAPRASRATCPVTPVLGPESRMVPVPVVPHYGCGRADTAPWPAHWPALHRPASPLLLVRFLPTLQDPVRTSPESLPDPNRPSEVVNHRRPYILRCLLITRHSC